MPITVVLVTFVVDFTDNKITENIYWIVVQSGVSPISSEGSVRNVWLKRVDELCRGEFKEFEYGLELTEEPTFPDPLTGFYMDQFRTLGKGYAICGEFNGTFEDAILEIRAPREMLEKKHHAEKALIDAHSVTGCGETALTADEYEALGNAYYKLDQFENAAQCFQNVYVVDKEKLAKTDVYNTLGLMFELGQGVEKNMDIALFWYGLAGLPRVPVKYKQ